MKITQIQVLKKMAEGYKIQARALNRWNEPDGCVALKMPLRLWLRDVEVPFDVFKALRTANLIQRSGQDRIEPKYEITSEGLKLVKKKRGKCKPKMSS